MNSKNLVIYLIFSVNILVSFETKNHVNFKDNILHEYPLTTPSKYFLVSYRSSGSHYLMSSIQFLTKEVWHAPHKDYYFFNSSEIKDSNMFFRGHECTNTHIFNEPNGYYFKYDKYNDFLILLTRNYKEVCFRKGILNIEDCDILKKIEKEAQAYFSLIELFDSWNPKKRLHIFYEDLIINPSLTLEKICNFLKVDQSIYKNLIQNLDEHKKSSFLAAKSLNGNSSPSEGCLLFHRKAYSSFLLKNIDYLFHMYNNKLFEKYLQRYENE